MAEIMKNSSVQLISGMAREKAIKHILHVLDFDNSLCQFVKSKVDFSVGSVFSVVPLDSNVEDIIDFSWGFGKGSDHLLPDRIMRTLKLNAEAVAVFDDVMGGAENVSNHSSYLTNNEVYHWITGIDASELKLKDLIGETGVSWHFLCVIFELDKAIDIKDNISNSKYELFKNILELVVGAYDGEGYIHWSPRVVRP